MPRRSRKEIVFPLLDLPTEILLEILSIATAATPATYHSFLLVSKHFLSLTEQCIQALHIVLEGKKKLASFNSMIQKHPHVRDRVRFLWIRGPSGLMKSILKACTRIESLACDTKTLAFLCSTKVFNHTRCTRLTLIEDGPDWSHLKDSRHGKVLSKQLKRLQIGNPSEFPALAFRSLTHIAFDAPVTEEHINTCIPKLPMLEQIVVVASAWHRQPGSTSNLLEIDPRVSTLDCGQAPWRERTVWRKEGNAGSSLWDQALIEKRSILVFRDAFNALMDDH